MKNTLYSLILSIVVAVNANAKNIWVSDEIEAPLRSSPELNAEIVSLLKAGQTVTLLEEKNDYVKIKTVTGQEGWLSNYYVLRDESIHEQFAPMKTELTKVKKQVNELTTELSNKNQLIEQLQSDVDNTKKTAGEATQRANSTANDIAKIQQNNEVLQKKLTEQNDKIKQLATALASARKKATDANVRYKSLVKVSDNAVEIDDQNRKLQEKVVQFEQQIQELKTQNQSLNAQIGKKEFIIGALTVLGGILIGYVLSILMPPRGRRSANSYSSL